MKKEKLKASGSYEAFLDAKTHLASGTGFDPVFMPDYLFPFQRSLVEWSVKMGRAATFADCGLGKTPMQLVWAQNVVEKTNKNVLILTPLAVGQQTVGEALKFGIEAKRSRDGKPAAKITITNYEKLHLFSPEDYIGVACDESSIIKHATGATQKAVTRFMLKMPYRSLWTATAAPNDFTELGTSSEALGGLNHSEMLQRFFKQMDQKTTDQYDRKINRLEKQANHFGKISFRVSQAINGWRLKGHAHDHFWRWVCSWARACRKPSDIGFPDIGYDLPELIQREHIVKPTTPPEGWLFTTPAFGLQEERDERRRTLKERCELVAGLVDHDKPAVVWCHMNNEGKLLSEMIPNSLEVSGNTPDDDKEEIVEWFLGNKCICHDPKFRSKLATWKQSNLPISNDIIKRIARSASLNPLIGSPKILCAENNTLQNIGKPILKNGNYQNQTLLQGNNAERKDIIQIPSSENQLSLPQSSIELNTLPGERTNPCENTMLHSQPMKKRSKASKGSVQFAEKASGINVDIDSTLTTATQQINTGECSALIATLDSENLETVSKILKEQQCICGHLSGNRKLISKSKIFGFGLNFQFCNHVVTFASHSYEQYYQSIRRCWRFGQTKPVTVDIIASEGEQRVRDNMVRKAVQADKMFAELVKHMNNSLTIEKRDKSISVKVPTWLT